MKFVVLLAYEYFLTRWKVFYEPLLKMAAIGTTGITERDVSAIFTTTQLLLQVCIVVFRKFLTKYR